MVSHKRCWSLPRNNLFYLCIFLDETTYQSKKEVETGTCQSREGCDYGYQKTTRSTKKVESRSRQETSERISLFANSIG